MKPIIQDAPERLDAILAAGRNDDSLPQPKCRTEVGHYSPWVDYETPPDKQEARAMCADCPLLDLCKEAGRASRPGWGVWGGIAWTGGRQHSWLVRMGRLTEEDLDLEIGMPEFAG